MEQTLPAASHVKVWRMPESLRFSPLVLALLAVVADDTGLSLRFSGGPEVRLATEVIDATLEDLAGPWRARAVPRHDRR